MKKITRCRLIPIVVVLGVVFLLNGEAVARHGGAHRWTAGPKTFKTVVTNPIAQQRNAQAWASIANGSVTVPIAPGRSALINTLFTAESRCTGSAGAWCSVRILIFGILGEPTQGDGSDFAFDSAATDFWEAHAATRHLCVRNARTVTAFVPVIVQWRSVGNALFRLDETQLDVQRADNCSPIDLTIQ
jgi:uncharacterized MAPEG superfamily protein